MLEAVIGAVVGVVLGAFGTWIVSRSERLKSEQETTNALMGAELAQRLGSMCSAYTPDIIAAEDVPKMRSDWEKTAASLQIRGFIGPISELSDAVNSYIDALEDYTAGKEVRHRVDQRRVRAMETAKILIFPSKAA